MCIWRSRSCWSCRFSCMRRACLFFRRPFCDRKAVASVPRLSIIFCQARRKRQRSRQCWQRQTLHCFLPQRSLATTCGSYRRPCTSRASMKKFPLWHPCRLRFRRNFFRLIPERRRLLWRPSFRRRRPGSQLFLPQCGSVGIWNDAPGLPQRTLIFLRWQPCRDRGLRRRSSLSRFRRTVCRCIFFPNDRRAMKTSTAPRFNTWPAVASQRPPRRASRPGGQPPSYGGQTSGRTASNDPHQPRRTGLCIFAGFSCRHFGRLDSL